MENINRVSFDEYCRALDKLRDEYAAAVGEKTARRIMIEPSYTYASGKGFTRIVNLGVNWAGIGTVSPAEAADYACKIQIAATYAATFKYNGFALTRD